MYSEVLLLFCVPTRSVSVPFYPYPYQFACFGQKSFKFDYPSGCVVTFHCGFNGIFPGWLWRWVYFHMCVGHACFLFCEMPAHVFCSCFYLGCLVSSYWYTGAIYMCWIIILHYILQPSLTFSQSVVLFFYFSILD